MEIEDGTGTGKKMKVDDENQAQVVAVTRTAERHANEDFGEAYSVPFSATPTGAGDCFLYIKNTNTKNMIIEGIGIKLAANEYIDVKIGQTGTPSGGSATTPANLNAGSAKTADVTAEDGVDITGLTGGRTAYRLYHATSNGTTYTNFEQDIIIPKNQTLTLYCQTGETAIEGFLDINFHS